MSEDISIAVSVIESATKLELTGFFYDGENESPTEETICFTATITSDGHADWDEYHTCHISEFIAISMAKVKAYGMAIDYFKTKGSQYVN